MSNAFALLERFGLEIWRTLVELSPSLLLGLLIAGVLHVFLPAGLIRKQMKAGTFGSVFKAVLIGVPMPLCSCGVVPTTLGLRRDGASRGAATGFLISTPQTGVDSVLVSATFLGWPFALFKLASAFITGLIGGQLVNLTESRQIPQHSEPESSPRSPQAPRTIKEVLDYAVFDLFASIDIWIFLGILISAGITIAVPAGALSDVSWIQGLGGMLLVLAIALPLYVCATGSVPIAASLIASGLPLGSALVFLMAGPATNAATIGAIFRALGGRVLLIYISVVAVMSVLLGLMFNWTIAPAASVALETHAHHGTDWLGVASAVVVSALLVILLFGRATRFARARLVQQPGKESHMTHDTNNLVKVAGMTCGHCVANVKKAVEAVEGVTSAHPDLQTGQINIDGNSYKIEEILRAIEEAGYKASV